MNRRHLFLVVVTVVVIFGCGLIPQLLFNASLQAVEQIEQEAGERKAKRRKRRIRKCPKDYYLRTRDGETVYVDKNDRECHL